MGILDRLFGLVSSSPGDGAEEALERLVDSIDPRLRLATRYRETLRPAVASALDFARRFVEALPPARPASAAAWGSDPCLRAFFATAGDVPLVLGRSEELWDYLAGNPLLEEGYTLLRMDYFERRTLGIALAGDAIQHEVAQTTVDFSGHRMRVFGDSEEALRKATERRAFDQVGMLALARLGSAQEHRAGLEAERSLLTSRLRLLQRVGMGLAPVAGVEAGGPATLAEIEAELERNARELEASGGGAARLEFEVRCAADALIALPQEVGVERRRIRVDSMNVLVEGGDAGQAGEVEFALVWVGDPRGAGHAFAPIRVARGEAAPAPTLAEATRNIVL